MKRALAVLVALGVLAPIASAQIIPTFRKDSATDGRGALDIVRVAMSRGVDGRLRGEVTMEKPWTTNDLRSATGPPGSICLTLYTKREPGARSRRLARLRDAGAGRRGAARARAARPRQRAPEAGRRRRR